MCGRIRLAPSIPCVGSDNLRGDELEKEVEVFLRVGSENVQLLQMDECLSPHVGSGKLEKEFPTEGDG